MSADSLDLGRTRTPFQDIATDAVVFWERGRVGYNLLLAAITLANTDFLAGYPAEGLMGLFVLATLANLVYCAGYAPDLLVQSTRWRRPWRHARWALLAWGVALGAVLAHMITSEPF
ncbi:MAG: hypothetical protein ACFE0P_02445 [Oceanicaulis sp.]